jgi:hypothetical protein
MYCKHFRFNKSNKLLNKLPNAKHIPGIKVLDLVEDVSQLWVGKMPKRMNEIGEEFGPVRFVGGRVLGKDFCHDGLPKNSQI